MAIDLHNETIVPINQSRKHWPGKRPNLATLYRRMLHPTNPLETILIGGRRYTSVEAIHRYIQRCNERGAVAAPADNRREEEIDAALVELGV